MCTLEICLQHIPVKRDNLQVKQGGPELTDTYKMVIDNIWKQGKISETVYK